MIRTLNPSKKIEGNQMFKKPGQKFKERHVQVKSEAKVAGIIEEEYGKYQIKAGRLSGSYVARAFAKPPATTKGFFVEAEGDSEQAAIDALKALIDARKIQRSEDRRWDEKSSISVPTEEEFLETLRQAQLSQAQVAMLKALSVSAENGLTFGQLARAAGYKSSKTGAKVFKKVGDLIADYLGIEIADRDATHDERSAHIVAFGHISEEDAPTVWVMHQELRCAVRATY